ncbi:suppressor of cytokine signaling 4-like [Hyla sarda]|uniref:suppressor of cytokine signaling 4-like n=1 Tax=Hyla sarda TaxID=327740 RepID=UPI0024C30C62|nr:suppressor of cytokine signaling 4-like [Hyla sarda]XP_056397284.1 suppressor of cytokine signaling 4-like [Hyla sarda]XP_056397285.1 suppressor of cytokine signaling 4-like [Hyla sarda]XP_056397286.1 suppressor of cytokine signaling 4-like [Hyla sarda]XP_056397287.1 suppressor of cytokine signaling 4-like [Hyla sarda]
MAPPAAIQHEEKDGENEDFYTCVQIHFMGPATIPELWTATTLPYYWGALNKYQADILLLGHPDGTFLLRNSSQDGCAFAVTFRRQGRTRHARVQYRGQHFSFHWGSFHSPSVRHLLEHYNDPRCCTFFEPLLSRPLNRSDPLSLQELCRATVNAVIPAVRIGQLPIPKAMKEYLGEYHYTETLPGTEEEP